MGGGGGNSGPTLQQQQLETEQALTNANLNIEENSQRKSILNALQGTRVFRGSALSRAVAGNTNTPSATPGPSPAQVNNQFVAPEVAGTSLLDKSVSRASGATSAGGAGASGAAANAIGGRIGGAAPNSFKAGGGI